MRLRHRTLTKKGTHSEQIYLYPRYALPVDPIQCPLGHPIARWYTSDGKQGKAPKDPEMLKALELFRSAPGKKAPERRKIAQDIWKILVDNQYSIGTVGLSPEVMGVRIVGKRLGNSPARQVNAQHGRTPCSSHPVTFFFKAWRLLALPACGRRFSRAREAWFSPSSGVVRSRMPLTSQGDPD